MKSSTVCLAMALAFVVIATLVPQSDANLSRRKKIMLAKKIGAILLLHRKKYLFAVPFPLPIPLPLLKKTQPIIYKERIPVPVEVRVPIAEPIPEPWPIHVPVHHHHDVTHHGGPLLHHGGGHGLPLHHGGPLLDGHHGGLPFAHHGAPIGHPY